MILLYIILIAFFFGWWLSTSEYAFSASDLYATYYFKSYWLLIIFALGILLGGIFWGEEYSKPSELQFSITTPAVSLILAFASFIAVLVTFKLSKLSSVIYAVFGSLLAFKYFNKGIFDYQLLYKNFFAWIFAPLIATLLSFLVTRFYKNFITHSQIHFLKLNQYLRSAIVMNAILFAVLIGANNGGVLILLNSTINTNYLLAFGKIPLNNDYFIYLISLLIIILFTNFKILDNLIKFTGTKINTSIESALIIILSSNIVLFFFTIPFAVIPLSIFQIVMASSIGNALTRQNIQMDIKKVLRWFLILLVTPATAFGITFLLLHLIRQKYILQNGAVNLRQQSDIINVATPIFLISIIILLVGILFYLIKENKLKLKAQKDALKHQKELFDNQKSLSVMQVKAILLENDSLNTKLELKRHELTNIALNISEQKLFLEEVHSKLRNIRTSERVHEKDKKIEELEKDIFQKMNFSQEIEGLYSQIETLHKDFNIHLTEHFPQLSENDIRLVTLLRLGFSTKHIASLNNISPKSVEIARYRLRGKLGLSHDQNLQKYLKTI